MGNKFAVTFDYESGLFVEVEDGELVVIPNGDEQAVVLPRLTQFSNPREFYEIYQDYYHHRAELRAGEVFIHEPAMADRAAAGWVFRCPGLLEVVDDPRKTKRRKLPLTKVESPEQTAPPPIPTATPVNIEIETAAPESVAPAAAREDESRAGKCLKCGSTVEERYAFCWNCGAPMKTANPTVDESRIKPSSRRMIIDMDGVPPADGSLKSGIFSSELPRQRRKLRRSHNSRLKVMTLLVLAGSALTFVITGVMD